MLENTALESKSFKEIRKEELMGWFKPTFSPEFISNLADRLTDVLTKRLEKHGDLMGAKLLNTIIVLMMFRYKEKHGKVQGIYNQILVEAVGDLSYTINLIETVDS